MGDAQAQLLLSEAPQAAAQKLQAAGQKQLLGRKGEGDGAGVVAGADVSVAAALNQLQQLSAAVAAGRPVALQQPTGSPSGAETPGQQSPGAVQGKAGAGSGQSGRGSGGGGRGGGGEGVMRVVRDAAWLAESGGRVGGLLERVLPPLAAHPRPAVRQAVAEAAVQLLGSCGAALGPPGSRVLLEVVLALAQDEWQQVSEECTHSITPSAAWA